MKDVIIKLKNNEDIENEIKYLDLSDCYSLIQIILNMCKNNKIKDNNAVKYIDIMFRNHDIELKNDFFNELKKIGEKYISLKKYFALQHSYFLNINKIIECKKILININGKIRIKNSDNFIELKDKIFKLLEISNAFNDKKFLNSLKATDIILESNKYCSEDWKFINLNEILDRLIKIKNLFGIKFLKKIGITIYSKESFVNLSFDKQIFIYQKIVKIINGFLVSNKNLFLTLVNLTKQITSLVEEDNFSENEIVNSCKSESSESENIIPESSVEEFDFDSETETNEEINNILSSYFEN